MNAEEARRHVARVSFRQAQQYLALALRLDPSLVDDVQRVAENLADACIEARVRAADGRMDRHINSLIQAGGWEKQLREWEGKAW